MSEVVEEHRSTSPDSLNVAVLTVSDTRTLENDTSGALIVALSEGKGHWVVQRAIVRDEPSEMRPLIQEYAARPDLHAILVTGGTGISARDQTFETVSSLLSKPLPGFGELFRMLSFAEIGPACMLSRAVGGLIGKVVILVRSAVRSGSVSTRRSVTTRSCPFTAACPACVSRGSACSA